MRPEHIDSSIPLFLPVTDEACLSLLDAGGEKKLSTLTDAELAAILVIQNLAVAAGEGFSANAAERVLAKLIAWAIDARSSLRSGLLSEAQRLFDPRKLYFGRKKIKSINLRYLMVDEVLARDYLLPDGKWDVGFKFRHYREKNPFSKQMVTPRHRELWLSPAQDRLIKIFRANMDEDLHVQGYAGIGKSHLLGALIEHIQPGKTLLLAHTTGKLEALRRRMGCTHGSYRRAGLTFKQFAEFLLYGPRHQSVSVSAGIINNQALAKEMNIFGVRGYDVQTTLNICLKVLESYCRSRDYTLSAKHLPHFRQPLSTLDARVLIQYSSGLWTYLESNPAWGSRTGFEALLVIKRASLAGCVVPARYTHVLIDESQDVPASLLQIIERGRQVLITLGDEYQKSTGAEVKRRPAVRKSDISYSVRSGRNVEGLVNPLIHRHSAKGKAAFEGASATDVDIEYYPKDFVPPEGCVVLTASHWDTMKWVIQMSNANCPLRFPSPEVQKDLRHFMITAIGLLKPEFYSPEQSKEGLHSHFTDMSSWQQVREENQFDESFLWVEAQLENGFNIADVTRLYRVLDQPGKSCMVMMAEEAGGMEFDKVLLTTELLTTKMFKNVDEFDQRICAVYIAISRAKRQLYIPCDVVEWVEYQCHQKFREMVGL